MSAFRKYPVFSTVLTLCGVLAAAEGWLIYDRYAASRDAAAKVVQKEAELMAMRDLTPVPTRPVATAIEQDLARAQRAVATMQTELKGRGPAAERLNSAKVPAARTEAYFDLATFVEKTRDLAKKLDVELRPEASRFGFGLYANEGPKEDRIAAVFHQRQIVQYIIESLLESRPRALLAVQRERALTKAEKEKIAAELAAAAAAATGAPAPEPPPEAAPGTGSTPEPDGPELFAIDPRVSARAAGYLDTTPVRVVFTGQTAALRAFLNKLASFELPVLVREVEVDSATAEESAAAAPAPSDEGADAAASIVLNVAPKPLAKPAAPAAKPSSALPIVAKPLSKFTVTLEYLDLVTAPAAPAEAPAAEAKPTT